MSDLGHALLLRGCAQVYTEAELHQKLQQSQKLGRPLRVKLGMDPTAPDLHWGHAVVLRKLRQFQNLGHKAVLIVGDFTARIGDPTGRSKTRPVLTEAEIDKNAETYFQQAGRILDMSPDKLEIRRNSEWLSKMHFDDVLRLAARMTVGQMLKRDDFRKRYEEETPISLHELLYPLVQGWDSVQVTADVELGGTDQTYNNLVGRQLQADMGQASQVVMVMPLLRGVDGVKKMSKSVGNYIGVTDSPTDMYGKTMSIPDVLLPEWFSLLTELPETTWQPVLAQHPMQAKDLLARTVGASFYSDEEMDAAARWWRERFGKDRQIETTEVSIPANEIADGRISPWKLAWYAHGQEISRAEAKRMVENGAFELEGEKIVDPNTPVAVREGSTFRAGRHRAGPRIKQPLQAVLKIGAGA
jgi:tyrosyl-tRNA synthetase